MAIYTPSADRYPTTFSEDFSNGIGNWIATMTTGVVGGPREVVNGVFRSFSWGFDPNHLTTKGGPGMLHLLAYADNPLWPDTDFTNARIKLRARGVSFDPNGSQFICWITANHPYVAGKNVNWGFIAEPRTDLLQTGNWEDVEWVLTPDPTKWVWGKGENGTIYDTFLSLQESLQNIFNIHFLMLGPDNVGHPAGTFELDSCTILYNRKAADPVGPRWGSRAPAVTLTNGNLVASHAMFITTGGVRANMVMTGKRYWETQHLSGDPTKCFAVGIVNSNYDPAIHGATFFADTVNGWGWLCERATRRHGLSGGGFSETSWGSPISSGTIIAHAFDQATGSYWVGPGGTWPSSGDPASGANPMYTGLTGDLYPAESNGTGQSAFSWRVNFGSSPFHFTPPTDFSGFA